MVSETMRNRGCVSINANASAECGRYQRKHGRRGLAAARKMRARRAQKDCACAPWRPKWCARLDALFSLKMFIVHVPPQCSPRLPAHDM